MNWKKSPKDERIPLRGNFSDNVNKNLLDENRRLKSELAEKNKLLLNYKTQIESLQKKVNELTKKNNNSNQSNYSTNNRNYQRSSSQRYPNSGQRSNNRIGSQINRMLYGDFDEFTDAFFNEPSTFFDDPFFNSGNRNRVSNNYRPQRYNYNQHDYYQPQVTDIEADIIDQLYPNPDNMTYEQLLALEEQVGSVSKGLSKNDINVCYYIIIYNIYVQKIPIVKFSKYRHKDCDKCAICQFEYKNNENLRKYKCGHLYHVECSDEWLKSNKTCPICKAEVK